MAKTPRMLVLYFRNCGLQFLSVCADAEFAAIARSLVTTFDDGGSEKRHHCPGIFFSHLGQNMRSAEMAWIEGSPD
jgi:hypothetical protein